MSNKTTKIQITIQTDLEDEKKTPERQTPAPAPRVYPLKGDSRGNRLDPSLLLADPPARIPLADRQTTISIYPNEVVFLTTNDPNVVRPIAKAIAQGEETWKPILISGANGRQTRWTLKGDLSLLAIRSRKFKRPGIVENLKKKKEK